MKPRALRAAQALSLLHNTLPPPARYAVALRHGRAADLALANLLLRHPSQHNIPLVFAPQREAHLLHAAHPSFASSIHTIQPDPTAPLRPYAAAAIHHQVHHIAFGTTQLEHAVAAVTSISAHPLCPDQTTGIEMLPKGTLTFHHPLSTVDHATMCSTVRENLPPDYHPAPHPLFMSPQLIPAALQQARQNRSSLQLLTAHSDRLLRDSVLEASHWGYIVARTSLLYDAFHSGRASRLAATHAMQRMCLHVSGSANPLRPPDAQLSRLCAAVFAPAPDGHMRALPKGRTAAGVVLRPATGRFARHLRAANDHLMMLTREPDHDAPASYNFV